MAMLEVNWGGGVRDRTELRTVRPRDIVRMGRVLRRIYSALNFG